MRLIALSTLIALVALLPLGVTANAPAEAAAPAAAPAPAPVERIQDVDPIHVDGLVSRIVHEQTA